MKFRVPPTIRLCFNISLMAGMTAHAQTSDAIAQFQKVLRASHATRINEAAMKPWHLKVEFQTYDSNGKPSNSGTLEEWWSAPLLWKIKIDSPAYSATVIENHDGDFRSTNAGPIPLPIRGIQQDFEYPMPMEENLGDSRVSSSHQKLDGARLDCIEISEASTMMHFPTYCFDPSQNPDQDVIRAIFSGSRSWVRADIQDFQGRSVAHSITVKDGKVKTATAVITALAESTMNEETFRPTSEMTKVTDMHAFKIKIS
jgi:hypothetical protein